MILAILALIAWIIAAVKTKRIRFYLVAPLLWLLSVIVFDIVRLMDLPIPVEDLNIWSLSMHLYVGLMVLGVGLTLIFLGDTDG